MSQKVKIVACGTFDLIHPGHIAFLKKAKNLSENSELIVVVARDITVVKEKRKRPILNEKERLEIVSSLKFVDKAILGSKTDKLEIIEKLKPDILVLGYDQKWNERRLEKELRRKGLKTKVIRLERYGNFSSSLLIKRIVRRYA